MIYVAGILLIIVFVLIYKLSQKQKLDTTQRDNYIKENDRLNKEFIQLQAKINNDLQVRNQLKKQISDVVDEYTKRSSQLQNHFTQLRKQRNEQLSNQFQYKRKQQQQLYNLQVQQIEKDANNKINQIKNYTEQTIQNLNNQVAETNAKVIEWEQQYNNLLQPFKRLQQQKMQHLFYTIQVPEQYQKDMAYLLTVVAPHVNHPDIISKLIWQEYVKPYIDDTFKRIGIKDQSGIYKLTYIQNNKCYVGKSTNVKKRIADHFKSAVGIQTIADQAVHHQIKNTGLWNWMIQVIGYFPKQQLNEKQKFYIKQFQAVEYGFNKNSGG